MKMRAHKRQFLPIVLVILVICVHMKTCAEMLCSPGEWYDSSARNCSACPLGTYQPEASNSSCLPCPLDDSGFPTVTAGTASTSLHNCTPEVHILDISPTQSVLAGGVQVVISLTHAYPASVETVRLAGVHCTDVTLDESNSTITCVSSAATDVINGTVAIRFGDDHEVLSEAIFHYRENPIVTSLGRYKSILAGGLLIEVFGVHMSSLVSPKFEIIRFNYGARRVFQEDCLVYNDTLLACKSPGVYEDFYHPALTVNPQERRRRDVDGLSFNGDFAQFYGGLRLDGVNDYVNLSDVFVELGQMLVYVDPRVDEFEGNYVNYDPQEQETLSIWGSDLDLACSTEDYRVFIGRSYCNITSLNTNHLTCRPPAQEPEPSLGLNGQPVVGSNGEPAVVVIVGNIRYSVGYVRYPSGSGGILWQQALGIVLGLLLGLILIVTAICLWLRQRRRQKAANNNLEMGPISDPNIYLENALSGSNDGYLKPCPTGAGGAPQGNVLALQPQRMLHSVSSQVSSRPSASSYESATSTTPFATGSSTPRQAMNVMNFPRSMSLSSAFFPRAMRIGTQLGTRSMSVSTSPPSSPGFISAASEFSVSHSVGSPMVYMEENVAYDVSRHPSLVPLDVMDEIAEELKLTLEGCLLQIDRLRLQDTLGKGFFGKVYKGELLDENGDNPKTVAVKTVQDHQCSVSDVTSFLEEAVVMKDFKHPNVLPLLGVVIAETKPFVILPYMEHGDLKSYVSSTQREGITVRELLAFGVQISDGMTYLSEQKFVHRDLATRNCMINQESVVKIADFGLSRDIYKCDYYRVETKHRPLPVKWMALESLTSGMFSSKSDVWSFGVLLWELLTRGCSPYADIDTFNIKAYLQKGYRLSQPEHAPDEAFTLMKSCWLENPDDRPTFQELNLRLQEILEDRDNDVHDYLQLVHLP